MNERIKELAEQAGIITNLESDLFEKDPNKWVDYFSEKFAELIVRECISVVNQRYMGDNNREDMEIRRCAEDLKNYFGVEK